MFCPNCGKEVTDDQAFCQYCGTPLAKPAVAPSGGRCQTSWENRENIGFLTGLLRTLKETLLAPSQFFRKMTVTGGLVDPILYAMIIGMAGLTFYYFWDILLSNPLQGFINPELRAAYEHNTLNSPGKAVTAILTPFILIFWLFIVSGMLHLFLLMVRGARASFEATFRVVSYGVAPFVFLIIPVCGMPVTSLWFIILAIIGLKEAHEITGGKATLAVLLPFLFFCGLLVLAIAVFMSAAAASFGWIMHLSH